MRVKIALLLLVAAVPVRAWAQTIHCELSGEEYGYGMFGTCRVASVDDHPPTNFYSPRLRYWPQGNVNVVISRHPVEGGPWRGYFFTNPAEYTDSFEMTKEPGPAGDRLILRSMVGWVVVHNWQKTAPGKASLDFRLNYPLATGDDVSILRTALNRLSTSAAWDRKDDRDCENDAPGQGSIFCVLQRAEIARMGRYHHTQPALDFVRRVIVERWADRVNHGHAFTNFNNHPDTTLKDVRDVLEESLRRASAEVASSK